MPVITAITATNFCTNGSSPLERCEDENSFLELDLSHFIGCLGECLDVWTIFASTLFIFLMCLCDLQTGLMSALRFVVSLLKGDHRGSVRIHFAQAFSLKV